MAEIDNQTRLPWHNPKFRLAHDVAYRDHLLKKKAERDAKLNRHGIVDTALDEDESNDPTDFLGEEHDFC